MALYFRLKRVVPHGVFVHCDFSGLINGNVHKWIVFRDLNREAA